MIRKFNKDIYDTEFEGCPVGSSTAYNYKLAIGLDGNEYLEAEEYDIQQVIDSYADQCSIERIMTLHGLGDDLILDSKPGVFLDEDDVKAAHMSSDQAVLNVELLKLYQGYKDVMSWDDFNYAITHGDFTAFSKKKDDSNQEEVK